MADSGVVVMFMYKTVNMLLQNHVVQLKSEGFIAQFTGVRTSTI